MSVGEGASTVSDEQVWAIIDDLRDFGPAITEVIIALVALKTRAPAVFARLAAIRPSRIVDLLGEQCPPDLIDVFPDLGGYPSAEVQLPAVIEHVATWSLPNPDDQCGVRSPGSSADGPRRRSTWPRW